MSRIGKEGRMWSELHYTASSSVVYGNPPDWNEMLAWSRLLSVGDRFIDVGSNVGSYALWTAEHGARVVAVEPSEDAFARLSENVALNQWPIEILRCALADKPGRMSFTSGLGTVNHLVVAGGGGHDEVEVRTLDSLIGDSPVLGVKIDVEGAERLVLTGAAEALSRGAISILQIEWNDASDELLGESRAVAGEILRGYGYRFFRPDTAGWLHPTDLRKGADLFAVAPGVVLPSE
jgi:FkbM family methyltransferase